MTRLIQRFVPVLLLLVLVEFRVLVRVLLAPNGASATLVAVTATFLLLLVLAVVGLWRGAAWGFIAFYLLVPVATVLHGIPLVPFVTSALPENLRPTSVMLLNASLFALVFVGQRLRGARTERLVEVTQ